MHVVNFFRCVISGLFVCACAVPLQCGAGGTSTFCVATGPQLYGWGKLKVSGDNSTHPMPVEDLSGWNVSVTKLQLQSLQAEGI